MSNTIETQPSLDVQWYPRFEQTGSFQAYEYLDGDKTFREQQKKQFLAGEIENPVLDYPKLKIEDLEKKEVDLLDLKDDILKGETDATIKQTYRWRLNEKIAELRMLKAVTNNDVRRFRKYTEFVYGKPSPEIFAYTIESLRSTLQPHLVSENTDLHQAAQALNESLPKNLPPVKISSLPNEESIQAAQVTTLKELGSLITVPEGVENFNAEGIKQAFEQALSTLETEGWHVVIDTSSKTGISVDQEKKTVKIPESRTLVRKKLRTLVVHEIGTHVARRINGERSRLMLLGLGLDRYEQGEEGVATAREQAMEGKVSDFAGLEGHLAISLAAGLDGKPRNFREVFEIMEKYFTFEAMRNGKDLTQAKQEAQTSAWNRCVRTFRGTDCATPGICFTKDIIYRQGNIGVWDVIGKNPKEMLRFNVGKYDPANPRHILILDQLNITEADLMSLQK